MLSLGLRVCKRNRERSLWASNKGENEVWDPKSSDQAYQIVNASQSRFL